MTTTTKTIASAAARSRAKAASGATAAKTTSTAAKVPVAKAAVAKAAVKAVPAKAGAGMPGKAAAPKPKPAPRAKPAASESPVTDAAAALVGAVSEALSIRKKELVDRVVAASGSKKKQVKDIVEHTLKVLGDALARGEELNLPPFGKARVNRSREGDKGTTMMVKVKQGGDQQAARKAARKDAKEGLAGADD